MSNMRQLAPLAVAERTTARLWTGVRARPRAAVAAVALVIVTAGIAMNWSALVAAGIAPLLISALPCAVMCALGLCMNRMGGRSSSTETGTRQSATATRQAAQFDAVAARGHGPESSADPTGPIDGDAVGADQLQQQERRPTHA